MNPADRAYIAKLLREVARALALGEFDDEFEAAGVLDVQGSVAAAAIVLRRVADAFAEPGR